MPRILIVDDDEAVRRLVRLNLTDLYEIFDTGKPGKRWHWSTSLTPFCWTCACRDIRVSNFAKR
jgi:CheY-like chemotaxis protein